MRHPGSGPQHTLSPQPSLTDGRGWGGVGWGGRSGDCILTIPRSILSSLNLPSFLPSLYPIYPLFSLLHSSVLAPPSASSPPRTFFASPPHPAPLPPRPVRPAAFPGFSPRASGQGTRREGGKKRAIPGGWRLEGEWAEGCALGQGA